MSDHLSRETTKEMRDKLVNTLDGLFRHLDAEDSSDPAKAIIVVYMVKLTFDLMELTKDVLKAEGYSSI